MTNSSAATATSPWDRIGKDVRYKNWLVDAQIAPDEYNQASIVERRSLWSTYEKELRESPDVASLSQNIPPTMVVTPKCARTPLHASLPKIPEQTPGESGVTTKATMEKSTTETQGDYQRPQKRARTESSSLESTEQSKASQQQEPTRRTITWKKFLTEQRVKHKLAYDGTDSSSQRKIMELEWICGKLDALSCHNCRHQRSTLCHCLSILHSEKNLPEEHLRIRAMARKLVGMYFLRDWVPMSTKDQKASLMKDIKDAMTDPNGYNVRGLHNKPFHLPFYDLETSEHKTEFALLDADFDTEIPVNKIRLERICQRLSELKICRWAFASLHGKGYEGFRGLEDHVRTNTVPEHKLSVQKSNRSRHAERVHYPILKEYFETEILPLAEPVKKALQDESDPCCELELDSSFSHRRLYKNFCWTHGWKVHYTRQGTLQKKPRVDKAWTVQNRTPTVLCSQHLFTGYWAKHYPNLRTAPCEMAAQREEERIAKGFNFGPWSKEEHKAFMRGYRRYGRNWKKIAEKFVPTRTNIQVTGHARRYSLVPIPKRR